MLTKQQSVADAQPNHLVRVRAEREKVDNRDA